MAEMRVSYSNALKDNDKMDTFDMTFSKLSTAGKEKITIKKSVIYVVLIVIAFILIFDGLLMYLIADGKQYECIYVLPIEYENSSIKVSTSKVGTNTATTSKAGTRAATSSKSGTSSVTGKTTKSISSPPTSMPGCPSGWLSFNQSCYLFSYKSSTFLEAEVDCIKFGGYLVEIDSLEEDNFLKTHASNTKTDCYTGSSRSYDGFTATTYKGRQCQRWDSQFPHKHSKQRDVLRFPEKSLTDAENYCRDPDYEGAPWCYTTDPNARFEFCGVYRCPGDFWIGLSRRKKWRWVLSNTELTAKTYQGWGNGKPTVYSDIYELCGLLSGKESLKWGDKKCFMPAFYICEK